MFGLSELLQRQSSLTADGVDEFFERAPEKWCSPGYWVAFSARARKRGLRVEDLAIPRDRIGYAQAIGINQALNERDAYPYGRINKGRNYSPLVVLADETDVDRATADICGCIREIFPDKRFYDFSRDLCDVVGDLHDNVWSHGLSTGISAAQKWRKVRDKSHYIEFALADCGYGFLRELRRSGVALNFGIDSHQQAVEWCIQKGNTSKRKIYDEWAQRLPEDSMGNPIGHNARVIDKENHHLGLGLHKLTNLVEVYAGELWIASGDCMLQIDGSGRRTYIQVATPWAGVALACRFATDRVLERTKPTKSDELDDLLLQLLSGESE